MSCGHDARAWPRPSTRNCTVHMYWKNSCGLPTLDCNLYSQAFSQNSPTPEHPIPFSITCAARSFHKSRDPAPSTEQDCNRIASVGRLFENRRRTEWRSVGAAACSDELGCASQDPGFIHSETWALPFFILGPRSDFPEDMMEDRTSYAATSTLEVSLAQA